MGRNHLSNDIQREESIKKIEETALLFFAKKGFKGTKITDISSYLNISPGLIYHYYNSKKELYQNILTKYIIARDKQLQNLVSSSLPAINKFIQFTNNIQNQLLNNPKFSLMFTLMQKLALEQGITGIVLKWQKLPLTLVSAIIEEGQKENIMYPGDPHSMALLYYSLIEDIAINSVITPDYCSKINFENIMRLIIREGERKCL